MVALREWVELARWVVWAAWVATLDLEELDMQEGWSRSTRRV